MKKKPLWLKDRDRVRDHGTTLDQFNSKVAGQSGKNLPLIAGGFRNNKGDEGTR